MEDLFEQIVVEHLWRRSLFVWKNNSKVGKLIFIHLISTKCLVSRKLLQTFKALKYQGTRGCILIGNNGFTERKSPRYCAFLWCHWNVPHTEAVIGLASCSVSLPVTSASTLRYYAWANTSEKIYYFLEVYCVRVSMDNLSCCYLWSLDFEALNLFLLFYTRVHKNNCRSMFLSQITPEYL